MAVLLVGLALPAIAGDTKADLDKRLRLLSAKFEELQAKPDKAVPTNNLQKANGIVLLYRVKGGLVVGYQGGYGVAMVKDATGKWSAPLFMKANEGSFGAQIGGQTSFTVILLMNTNAVNMLMQPNFAFGGEASGTGGDAHVKESTRSTQPDQLTAVYSDVAGLYGGATVKGGSLSPDDDNNRTYYGKYLAPQEILSNSNTETDDAYQGLADKINQYTK
jgi:lipid-binding SYLF domain-containing protein